MTNIPFTIDVIEKLRWNSHLGKHGHFTAAKKRRRNHILCGIPIVIINLFIGSVFFSLGNKANVDTSGYVNKVTVDDAENGTVNNINNSTVNNGKSSFSNNESVYWIAAFLALIAATLGGIQTFFDFKKKYEGHREVGNEYLAIARECERLIALYFDKLINLEDLSAEIKNLNKQYESNNQKAQEYHVSDREYKIALEKQKKKARSEPSLVARMSSNLKTELTGDIIV